MSNDLENEDIGLGETGFDDFEDKKMTLGDLWRENAMFKIGVIIAGVIVVFGGIFMFSGSEKPTAPSYVPTGSDISAPPGTTEATPAYIQAIEDENQERLEQALQQNQSALPTPIDTPVGRVPVPTQGSEEDDPLQRWRKLQEERAQRELENRNKAQQQTAAQPGGPGAALDPAGTEAVNNLAEQMAEQMQGILERQNSENRFGYKQVTPVEWLESLHEQQAIEEQQKYGSTIPAEITPEILVPAGQIAYAQLLTEANSDVPGPVLAQIVSGPLKGNRVLGSFEVQNDLITLNFNTIVIDGVSYSINSIALDPGTTLPGMATEVDHRYLKRILLPMAAAFVEGAAEAISESGQTTLTINNDTVTEQSEDAGTREEIASGIQEAGQELRDILDDIADETKTLVIIHAGTPFGLLFLESVLKGGPQAQSAASANYFPGGAGTVPGTGVNIGNAPGLGLPYGATPGTYIPGAYAPGVVPGGYPGGYVYPGAVPASQQ